MRIALFGGTFDPIHRGHLAIALAAAEAFALHEVLFAPTGRQPLKPDAPGAPYADRFAMVRLALEDSTGLRRPSGFVVSDLDAPHPDGSPNYTANLLAELCRERSDAEIFAIAGADSFLSLPRWHSPERVLALAQWIVVSRPGSLLEEEQLAGLGLTPRQRERIHLLEGIHEDVSATDLRRRLSNGDPCVDLLPSAVAAYIQSHNLYR